MKKRYAALIILCIIFAAVLIKIAYDITITNRINNVQIMEEKQYEDLIFKTTGVVLINGRTIITATIDNNSNYDFQTEEVIFKLLDFNNNIIEESSEKNVFVTAKSQTIYNISFSKPYDNIYDIKYIIK